MATQETLSLMVGAVEVALVFLLTPRLWRFRRTFPWLGVLLVYFAVRGGTRVAAAFDLLRGERTSIASDVIVLAMLAVLFGGIERTVSKLQLATDEAEVRRSEYDRALLDYRTLARHRLATPLTTIRGTALTLKDVPTLDREQTEELLDALLGAADALERVTLEPTQLRPEERGLRPVPGERAELALRR